MIDNRNLIKGKIENDIPITGKLGFTLPIESLEINQSVAIKTKEGIILSPTDRNRLGGYLRGRIKGLRRAKLISTDSKFTIKATEKEVRVWRIK